MLISMELISGKMNNRLLAIHLVSDSQLLTPMICSESTCVDDPAALYICEASQLYKLKKNISNTGQMNLAILNDVDELPAYIEKHNYMLLKKDSKETYDVIVNGIYSVFHLFNTYEAKMLDLISQHASFQELLDLAWEIVPYTAAVMDEKHEVIAATNVSVPSDTLFFSLKSGYGYEFLNIINKSNPTLDEVEKMGVCETTSKVNGKRLRVYRFYGNSQKSLFVGFNKDDDRAFSLSEIRVLDYIVDMLQQLADMKNIGCHQTGNEFEQIMEELISGREINNRVLLSNISNNNETNTQQWMLLRITFNGSMRFRTSYHDEIIKQINKIHRSIHSVLIHAEIAIILDNPICYEEIVSKLQYILITNDAVCATSSIYSELSNTREVWNQLGYIIECSHSESGKVLNYVDFWKDHCLTLINNKYPKDALCHPALQDIKVYDEQKGTNYFETFVCYLQNNCSVSQTSRIMDVHRNSILYRIRKIEEIIGFEIATADNRLAILFSSFLLDE